MKYIITLLLFLSAAGSCDAAVRDWDSTDKKLYASYIILNAVDTIQTFDLIDCQNRYYLHGIPCTVHEANPLWGNPPKRGTVLSVKLASGLINTLLMDNMSTKDRRFTLKALNGIAVVVVLSNHEKGLSWRINF